MRGCASVDEAVALRGWSVGAFKVGTADIDGVLEGALFDGKLGDEAGGVGGGDAGGVVAVGGLGVEGSPIGEDEASFSVFWGFEEATVRVGFDAEGEDKVAE